MTTILSYVFALVLAAQAQAQGTPKFTGPFDILAGGPHKEAIVGTAELYFEGDQITQILLKSTKPVFGKTDFPSAEQKVFSRVSRDTIELALAFKLKGPPHKWYFVWVGASVDGGKTYSGKILKAVARMDQIGAILATGEIPAAWKAAGKLQLTAR